MTLVEKYQAEKSLRKYNSTQGVNFYTLIWKDKPLMVGVNKLVLTLEMVFFQELDDVELDELSLFLCNFLS